MITVASIFLSVLSNYKDGYVVGYLPEGHVFIESRLREYLTELCARSDVPRPFSWFIMNWPSAGKGLSKVVANGEGESCQRTEKGQSV